MISWPIGLLVQSRIPNFGLSRIFFVRVGHFKKLHLSDNQKTWAITRKIYVIHNYLLKQLIAVKGLLAVKTFFSCQNVC